MRGLAGVAVPAEVSSGKDRNRDRKHQGPCGQAVVPGAAVKLCPASVAGWVPLQRRCQGAKAASGPSWE